MMTEEEANTFSVTFPSSAGGAGATGDLARRGVTRPADSEFFSFFLSGAWAMGTMVFL